MVNEISKRPKVFLENAVFYFAFFLLLFVISGFFYFRHEVNQANEEMAVLDVQWTKMKTEEQKGLESRVAAARRRMSDFSKIMEERYSAVNFFSEFENMVFSGVYYSKLGLDFPKKSVSLTGRAGSFSDVGRQGMKFSAAKDILVSWPFAKIAVGEDSNVDFDINLLMNSNARNFKYAR